MNKLIQDLKYGTRILLKQPGFTLVAVVTLALGIGANTAIFSLVNSILLRPLPFRDPDRVVRMIQASPKLGLATWGVSQAGFNAYREQNRSFETMAIYNNSATNLTGRASPSVCRWLQSPPTSSKCLASIHNWAGRLSKVKMLRAKTACA